MFAPGVWYRNGTFQCWGTICLYTEYILGGFSSSLSVSSWWWGADCREVSDWVKGSHFWQHQDMVTRSWHGWLDAFFFFNYLYALSFLTAPQPVEVRPIWGMKLDKWYLWLNFSHVTSQSASSKMQPVLVALHLLMLPFSTSFMRRNYQKKHFKIVVFLVLFNVWVSCIVDVWLHIMLALERLLLICNLAHISYCADQHHFWMF